MKRIGKCEEGVRGHKKKTRTFSVLIPRGRKCCCGLWFQKLESKSQTRKLAENKTLFRSQICQKNLLREEILRLEELYEEDEAPYGIKQQTRESTPSGSYGKDL